MKRLRLKAKERNVLRELERVSRTSGPVIEVKGLAERLGRPYREVLNLCQHMSERGLVEFSQATAVRATELGRRQIQ